LYKKNIDLILIIFVLIIATISGSIFANITDKKNLLILGNNLKEFLNSGVNFELNNFLIGFFKNFRLVFFLWIIGFMPVFKKFFSLLILFFSGASYGLTCSIIINLFRSKGFFYIAKLIFIPCLILVPAQIFIAYLNFKKIDSFFRREDIFTILTMTIIILLLTLLEFYFCV
jgi:hypothetical protein